MSATTYPLIPRPEEIKRLRVQAESLAQEAGILLDLIPVTAGQHCLDLGCGAGGIVDLLSARVGATGSVLGVDLADAPLAAARLWAGELGLDNVRFEAGSIFDNDLAPESFDLVHLRYVVTTIGRHEEVIAAALRLLRPGGVLALEEADANGIDTIPANDAFERLKEILCAAFVELGADPYAGRQLFRLFHRAGLEDVDLRVCTARARSHDELVDYLPQTILSMREGLPKYAPLHGGEVDRLLEHCRRHLAEPETMSTTSLVFQVWGRKPA